MREGAVKSRVPLLSLAAHFSLLVPALYSKYVQTSRLDT